MGYSNTYARIISETFEGRADLAEFRLWQIECANKTPAQMIREDQEKYIREQERKENRR